MTRMTQKIKQKGCLLKKTSDNASICRILFRISFQGTTQIIIPMKIVCTVGEGYIYSVLKSTYTILQDLFTQENYDCT